MTNNKKKILIATGGTGGHIFPSISIAEFLKSEYKIQIITDQRGLKYLKKNENIDIKIINPGLVLKKNLFQTLYGFLKLCFSFIYSFFLILTERPKLIIGMGGYSTIPICFIGFIFRVPLFIYENNLIVGKANRFLLPMAKKILVSTESIKKISNKYTNKLFFSGFLIRSNILNLQQNKIDYLDKKEKQSILIIGGSQSAKIFGEVLPSIISRCFKNNLKFKVYQQCLENQKKQIKTIYEKLNIEFELFSFSEDMTKYYKFVDLAITRSGASSLAELINSRIPFVAVPLPSSADNHQFENAKYFEDKGYCYLLEERFIQDKLFEILTKLNKDENILHLMKQKMEKHSDKESFAKIKKLIDELLNE